MSSISQLESSIQDCSYAIEGYENIKTEIYSVIKYLNNATNNTNRVIHQINDKYVINDENAPIAIRIKQLEKDIENTISDLKNVAIPEIDAEIGWLYGEIETLETELQQMLQELQEKQSKGE